MSDKVILFVSTSPTLPITDGKRQRTWFLVDALSKEYIIDMLLIGYPHEKEIVQAEDKRIRNLFFINAEEVKFIQPGYKNILLTSVSKESKKEFIRKWNNLVSEINFSNYLFVFSRYAFPFLLLPKPKNIKVICDIDDVYFQLQKTKIRNESNWKKKLKLILLYLFGYRKVKNKYQEIDLPLVVKDSDKNYPGLNNAMCLPNLPFGYFIDKLNNDFSIIKDVNFFSIGFLGKLSYAPNYKSLIQFIKDVWNPLQKINNKIKLIIAGSGEIPIELMEVINQSSNIVLLGYIKNTNDFWNRIDLMISPVKEGGGSNIKIAEALMHGKMILADTFSVKGYEDFQEKGWINVASNSNEWIDKLAILADKPQNISQELISFAYHKFNLQNWEEQLIKYTNL